ncbi:MAG: hypothetical protein JSS44_13805 [Proteobacteria bacterium]|nr:hypothetical protein [Pseudomonadota bacterium]
MRKLGKEFLLAAREIGHAFISVRGEQDVARSQNLPRTRSGVEHARLEPRSQGTIPTLKGR